MFGSIIMAKLQTITMVSYPLYTSPNHSDWNKVLSSHPEMLNMMCFGCYFGLSVFIL